MIKNLKYYKRILKSYIISDEKFYKKNIKKNMEEN